MITARFFPWLAYYTSVSSVFYKNLEGLLTSDPLLEIRWENDKSSFSLQNITISDCFISYHLIFLYSFKMSYLMVVVYFQIFKGDGSKEALQQIGAELHYHIRKNYFRGSLLSVPSRANCIGVWALGKKLKHYLNFLASLSNHTEWAIV